MDVKKFTISINVTVDGKYYSSAQSVDGDVNTKLLKQMYQEAYNKVMVLLDTKYPEDKVDIQDPFGR